MFGLNIIASSLKLIIICYAIIVVSLGSVASACIIIIIFKVTNVPAK